MSRHLLISLTCVAGLLLLGVVPAMAATQPTLYTISSGTPKVLGQGVQKSWPVEISESNAFGAVFQGGMWLPDPAGGRIFAKYQRHVLHDNGTWTWFGTVSSVHGDQSVVLTFGKDGVFGLIPQPSGYPLRVVTRQGQTSVVETSAQAMASSAKALRLYSRPDYFIPPRVSPRGNPPTNSTRPAAGAPVRAAAASGTVTIDVMVAYTPGFVTELGSQSLALTRIQNLIDMTNQAYTTSGVKQQIRLVHTVQVDYPDNTSNQSALDDITGIDEKGNPVTIPSSLKGIAGLRKQYGADLVTLIRSFDVVTQDSCGVGWLIGGNQEPIVPSQSYVYGYNVVSDGTSDDGDETYYCLDTTFAHELGHNMGNAHDRSDAQDPDGAPLSGAYSYSYGYLGTGSNDKGFSTIMAYGTPSDSPLSVFSNPDISICLNSPCGVPDSDTKNSADNVHSMNNTASLIAQFEGTEVGTPPPLLTYVHNDASGDGKSDLLWYDASAGKLSYWVMNGGKRTTWRSFAIPGNYQAIGTGDFDGNGQADILWKDSSGKMFMWLSSGSSFTTQGAGAYPAGWNLAGTGDIDGDGRTDLIWYNPASGQATYWLMDGSTMTQWKGFRTSAGLQPLATGDFDGNGLADIIWKSSTGPMYMWLFQKDGSFTYHNMGSYPSGWMSAGVGDVDSDGESDLFWYNQSTGQMTYWLMHGATRVSWHGYRTNNGMKPLATGEFDGSHAGLTWELPTGAMYMWIFKGSSLSYYPLGAYPTGWSIIP